MTKYAARFSPQAWINDTAVEVDGESPKTWDATAFMKAALVGELEAWAVRTIERGSDHDDILRSDPNAPEWVREWAGPFDTYVEAVELPEWTVGRTAATLRTLGLHLVEVKDGLPDLASTEFDRQQAVADALDAALDSIDSAIRELEDDELEDDDDE
jgi:hypothetical protein